MSHVTNTYARLSPAFSLGEGCWRTDAVVRLLPSLNFGENEARELVARSAPLIKEFLAA